MQRTEKQNNPNQTTKLVESKMQKDKNLSSTNVTTNNNYNKKNEEVMSPKETTPIVESENRILPNSITDNLEQQMESLNPTIDQVEDSETIPSPTEEQVFRKANARVTASLRNIRLQKQKSLKNLLKQLRGIRNTINRGYYIFEKEEIAGDPEAVKKIHHKLDEAEREFLRKKREELRIKILALQNEIEEYTANLKSQSYRTKMSFSRKYSKMVLDRKLKKATSRIRGIIEKQLLKDSRNGKREVLLGIRVETNEVNQKQSFLDYIGTILSPNDLHYFEIPQLQESITKRGLVYLKETEF